MTGIQSYSTTASENVAANTGITWDEGMNAGLVNNSARQNMADMRSQWNDAVWFQYGVGSKTVPAVYASSSSFTLAGPDATPYWHTGRRVRASGSSTGTIYGTISSSAFSSSTTTVHVTWDSGSLANETLTIYASIIPVTGYPITNFSTVRATDTIFTPGITLSPDSGSGGSIAITGFGETGTLNNRSFTTTDGSGLSMVCISNGVILNNGATSWSAISDEKDKTALVPITNASAKIDALRSVTGRYTWDEEGKSRPFLIAQDVQAVLPEAVYENDGRLTLAYTDLIPLLVAALKEANSRIAALEAR